MNRPSRMKELLGDHGPALALPELSRLLDEITALVPKIKDAYWWAHEAAYGGSGAGVGERGSRNAEDPSWRAMSQLQQPERAKAARGASKASAAVTAAAEVLSAAYGAVDRAVDRAKWTDFANQQQTPRTATKADLKDGEEAKKRREGRDEGWGRA